MIDVPQVQAQLAQLPTHDWQAEENAFTQMRREDRLKYLGGLPPPPHSMSFTPKQKAGAVYPSIDYKHMGYIPDILDQGGCGSCVCNAAAGHLQTVFRQRIGTPSFDIHPDRQIMWDCSAVKNGFGCKMGWYANQALDYLIHVGTFPESFEAYIAQDSVCVAYGPDELAQLIRIGKWNPLVGGDAIKAALQVSTMMTDFAIYSSFFSYASGVYKPLPGETPVGYHCVEITAWDEARKCWGGRNSWNYWWGDQGSFYLAEDSGTGFANTGYQIDPTTLDAPFWNIHPGGIDPHKKPVPPPPPPPDVAVLQSPIDGAQAWDGSGPFVWTEVPGATAYYLYVGTSPGLKDVYDGGETQALSATVASLPLMQPLYAQVWTKAGGHWHAAAPILFTSSKALPSDHAEFTNPGKDGLDPSQTIAWTRAPGADAYYLYVGTALGRKDVVNFGETLAAEYRASNLPRGVPLFFRIYTKRRGEDGRTLWPHTDVTITL